MADCQLYELPWPPSVNGYWRSFRGRQIISRSGREYRDLVQAELAGTKAMLGRLKISICLHPPDKRRRDIDNVLKAIFDSLVHAGAMKDDSQIDELYAVRREVVPGGLAIVELRKRRAR